MNEIPTEREWLEGLHPNDPRNREATVTRCGGKPGEPRLITSGRFRFERPKPCPGCPDCRPCQTCLGSGEEWGNTMLSISRCPTCNGTGVAP